MSSFPNHRPAESSSTLGAGRHDEGALGELAFETDRLGKTYSLPDGALAALQDITLRLRPRAFVCIVGPSGCGKTTLLKLLARLFEPTAGEIRFPSAPLNGQPRTALVFQDHGLFPWMSVLDNVAFCLEARGVDRSLRRARGTALLASLGLGAFAERYPGVLSAGMRQRVGIARALLADPQVLLMDEPFGALDAQTRRFCQKELLRHWDESPKAVVFVTHDVDEAVLLGDRVVVLSRRPGRVVADFVVPLPRPRSPSDIERPDVVDLKQKIWRLIEEEAGPGLQAAW